MDLPVNAEICFSNHKGAYKKGQEKRQRKLLTKAAPLLRNVLEPGEEILYVAQGASPFSALEFLTTGWIILVIKRCLLVITNRRLLHLPTKSNLDPKMSISQARWGDIERLKTGAFGGKLSLTYRNGAKEQFQGLRGADAKKLKSLLPEAAGHGEPSPAGGRYHLCPRCGASLSPQRSSCPGCNLAFKDKSRAIKYSILFPGGGYFYTRHPFLGLADALVEGLLLLLVVGGVLVALDGDPEGWMTVGVFGVLLAIEKLITVYHASHYVGEFLPAERNFKPGPEPHAIY